MNELYADIIVDISVQALDRPFSYRIPDALRDTVSVGSLVTIPFGPRMVRGYVIRLKDSSDYDPDKIKDIAAVLTDEETVEARLIALAGWMCRTYGGVMAQSLRTVLPLGKKVNPLTIRRASITDRNMAIYYKGRLGKRQQGRARVIDSLLEHDDQLVADLMKEQNVSIEIIRGLEKDGIICVMTQENYRKVIEEAEAMPPDVLTGEQGMAVRKIRTEWSTRNRPVLLKGITGSGKTLVYMELIADTLAEGKQVIMLIPEIALTRQTVTRFVKRFGEKVSFLHSRLSEGERYDQMKAAKRGDVSIMVGPRSALFTPFTKLGLIIIDEEHEETYRSEMTPRYHARETAEKRAEIEGAHLLLGSATPSITSAYRVWEGRYAGESLTQRYGSAMLPKTLIVDMREEAAKGNRSMFSEELSGRLRACLDRGEQAMLFLNRRGYAGFVTCRSCGFVAKCPHCDVSLTRHANGKLICHYCGYEIPEYMECPQHAGKGRPRKDPQGIRAWGRRCSRRHADDRKRPRFSECHSGRGTDGGFIAQRIGLQIPGENISADHSGSRQSRPWDKTRNSGDSDISTGKLDPAVCCCSVLRTVLPGGDSLQKDHEVSAGRRSSGNSRKRCQRGASDGGNGLYKKVYRHHRQEGGSGCNRTCAADCRQDQGPLPAGHLSAAQGDRKSDSRQTYDRGIYPHKQRI